VTIKNDARVYQRIVDLHEQFVADWKPQSPDGDFITQVLFQSIPTIFTKHSIEKGGNMFGLDRVTENAVMVECTLAVKGEDQEAVGRQRMVDYRNAIKQASQEFDAAVDWEYLNYADYTQDPLKNYGEVNVNKMREASAKYDPTGVFQTRMPGGFKISKVV
jgi:hypothetical protein